jgi:hypothetical protein
MDFQRTQLDETYQIKTFVLATTTKTTTTTNKQQHFSLRLVNLRNFNSIMQHTEGDLIKQFILSVWDRVSSS